MDTNTTRRNLLRFGTTAAAYAAGASIVTGGIALASQAKGAAPAVTPQLAKLLRDYTAADDALNHFYETAHNPAVEREAAMREAYPHIEHAIPTTSGNVQTFTTAKPMDIAQARHIAKSKSSAECQHPAWPTKRERARAFYAAHLRRERAFASIRRTCRMDAINARETALFVPYKAAVAGIAAFPVATVADLNAKMAHLLENRTDQDDDLFDTIQADVRQLLTREVR
ncbi:hypothetical protein [Sphingomonas faeni]|uniref:hypothetical protein n=1 Tax=Sphingomonas faeni TaxID=185950 RepID=UPI00334F4F16